MCCSRLCVWTLELKLPLLFIGEVCMWLKGVGTLRESITNQLGSIKPEMEMISWNSDARLQSHGRGSNQAARGLTTRPGLCNTSANSITRPWRTWEKGMTAVVHMPNRWYDREIEDAAVTFGLSSKGLEEVSSL